jgi:hypothetical protein
MVLRELSQFAFPEKVGPTVAYMPQDVALSGKSDQFGSTPHAGPVTTKLSKAPNTKYLTF